MFFDTASAVLNPRAEKVLFDLAQRWKRNGGYVLELTGHTDQQEARDAARSLGMERAAAAKSFLVSKGIQAQRIIIEDAGATQPLARNEGREPQNRRVEARPLFKADPHNTQAYLRSLECRIWIRDHCFMPSRLAPAGAGACNAALSAATDS